MRGGNIDLYFAFLDVTDQSNEVYHDIVFFCDIICMRTHVVAWVNKWLKKGFARKFYLVFFEVFEQPAISYWPWIN